MEKNQRVTILHWYDDVDALPKTVAASFAELGYEPSIMHYTTDTFGDSRFLFTYAPWGRLQRVTAQLAKMAPSTRPYWIHWSTEDCPDIRLPGSLTVPFGRLLAWLDRFQDGDAAQRRVALTPAMRWVNTHLHKPRYVGIYHYAIHTGLMGLLVEYSKVYADYYNRIGIPARYAQWGALDGVHGEDLHLDRDIDVLWIGTRRTKRRSKLLDSILSQLSAAGKRVHIVDGVINPPVYGHERAVLLNRAKITLNLLPTWYDSALAYRWPLVAANKSLLVTETSLPHAPEFWPGEHYVAAPVTDLVDTILDLLAHPEKRAPIVERAYDAVMHGHTILDSVRQIMAWAQSGIKTVQKMEQELSAKVLYLSALVCCLVEWGAALM
ncbi:MAG: glycosyltransferase family 1 protein [Caldilineaceae bacterium]|nr:glycosyltransferase family 1 protein [Caldilineaceae bacterium]